MKFILIILMLSGSMSVRSQTKIIRVDTFEKIIISPHIQVTFKKGDTETVAIEDATVSSDKINVEVLGTTLRVYLDDAKTTTKNKTVYMNGRKQIQPIYKGTVLKAVITYKNLKELSLRGEQTFVCESLLDTENFRLKIYGESEVYLNLVQLKTLHTTIYGESYLEIKKGSIEEQKITAYGESKINTLGVDNRSTKITSYGDGSYRFTISDNLKVTAFGETTVAYQGNPDVDKGIVIGESTIRKMQ
ncbi:DUF2807 domain-containing protein [Aquimarina sp. RZ0]|nr:DUF2807 domain-containing protein [Aquimarina sp. RZ0]